jgi:glutamate mutase epsilon subunit
MLLGGFNPEEIIMNEESLKNKIKELEEDIDMLRLMHEQGIDNLIAANLARSNLEMAIRETIEENLHLADGDNCTLIKLKRAINYA